MKISKRIKIGSILFLIGMPTFLHSLIVMVENASSMTGFIYFYFLISGLLLSQGVLLLFLIEDKHFEKEKTRIEKLAGLENIEL